MVGRSIGDVLGAAEIVEDVADRVCGRERRAEPRDQVVVIPSAAGYPPQLVDMPIGAEIDDILWVLDVEHVASGIARGEWRPRQLCRLAPIMPAIGRGGPAELVDIPVRPVIVDVLREFPLESVASGIADGRNRRASDGREVAAVMPVPSAVSPKLTNRSRA